MNELVKCGNCQQMVKPKTVVSQAEQVEVCSRCGWEL